MTALVGAEIALEMLGFGQTLPASAALRVGLIDAIADGDASAHASEMPAFQRTVPGDRTVRPAEATALRAALRRRAPGQSAPLAALHAISQARTLPFQRGLAETRRLARALHNSAQGAALRHAADCDGASSEPSTTTHRLRWGLLREAIHLVDDGASPQAVDLALRGFGFGTPPLAAADRDGIDAVVRNCVDTQADVWVRYSPTLDLMLDAGRTGRATGLGWYRYNVNTCQPLPDPALDPLLVESARAGQRRRRPVSSAEIVTRSLAAAVAMAATLCDEGVAGTAIDAISLTLGFPRWRGGLPRDRVAGGREAPRRVGEARPCWGECPWRRVHIPQSR